MTDRTFGFDTAVSTATNALDKLHSTAKSHDRVMVVEVMGRGSGWIALYSGISGGADVILIPEIAFDIDRVCEKIADNDLRDKDYSIVVVAEGAKAAGGQVISKGAGELGREEVVLGGIGEWVASEIRGRTEKDTRSLVLGPFAARRLRPPILTGCWPCALARRRCAWLRRGHMAIWWRWFLRR